MSDDLNIEIHPREVANKASKESLQKAIAMALRIESDALRLNTQTFNTNRYSAVGKLEDYEELKNLARKIKEESIRDLSQLIDKLTRSVEARGGKVFLARTKEDATRYIRDVCQSARAKLVVKAKSITSEEIGLNRVLEEAGIEVAETDLAEFILQISKEQPSHIVAPAIHRSRERISRLFKEHFKTDKPLDTGEQLTEFARDILREKFLAADVGITGANLLAAEEGTILLVESEGNIRLTTQLPAVHIAIAGIEKIIPSKKEFGTFIELLAASGTGQSLTSYTNILEPPLDLPVLNLNGREDKAREFHLVLLDNGRMQMREDQDLREALYCMRCSACMNVCANFQAVGGHAFGGECYTGGIGAAWTIGTTGKVEDGRFAELCTGCSRCVPNCPVRIDIPHLNNVIKERLLTSEGGASLEKKFFGSFSTFAKFASYAPGLSNWINELPPTRALLEKFAGVDKRRALPRFAEKTLVTRYKEYRKKTVPPAPRPGSGRSLVLFPDVFTNYQNAGVGMATVRVFEGMGLPVSLGKVMEDGRSAQSQGLLGSAKRSAEILAAYLEKLIDDGSDIIVAEPSVLGMFRADYAKLIGEGKAFAKLQTHTYDPIEWLNIRSNVDGGLLSDLSDRARGARARIFYHAHCQMKGIGAGTAVPELFGKLGLTVETSTVECCGMAGSFGYKKEYYEVSKNIGRDLAQQIEKSTASHAGVRVLASGTSCREQIRDEIGHRIEHPIEFLDEILNR
jgi:iron-sulfur cluster protein